MKRDRIIYWVSTSVIFLFDTVMPALTSHTQLAIEGIRQLGYPDYFRIQLVICKIIGGFLLIIPGVPPRLKEWAYVGFAINFLSASVGHFVVDGMDFQSFLPLIILGILAISYMKYHRIKDQVTLEGETHPSHGKIQFQN